MAVDGRQLVWELSSVGRASALQAEGHRFEPCTFHQRKYRGSSFGFIQTGSKGKQYRANFRRTFATVEDRTRSSRETEPCTFHQRKNEAKSFIIFTRENPQRRS